MNKQNIQELKNFVEDLKGKELEKRREAEDCTLIADALCRERFALETIVDKIAD